MKRSQNKMRIFIIECPDPMDLLQERSEGQGLEKICKLIGHGSKGVKSPISS